MDSYSLADFVAFDLLAWRGLIGRYWSEDGALILTMTALLVVATVFGIYKRKRWSVYFCIGALLGLACFAFSRPMAPAVELGSRILGLGLYASGRFIDHCIFAR